MNLPQNKKLTYVLYVFEDGDAYKLDRENAENYQKKVYSSFSHAENIPVDWKQIIVDRDE